MIHQDKKLGFTLVELMLAMTFLSFLLISMALSLSDLLRDYSKGNAMKQMNQTARLTIEDLSRSIRGSDASAINETKIASNKRLCLYGTSYVWNEKTSIANTFAAPNAAKSFRLIQVSDPIGALCNNPSLKPEYSKSTILLTTGILIQKFEFNFSESSPGVKDKRLVGIKLQLSTDGDEAPTPSTPTTDAVCPTNQDGDFCAVTKFETIVNTQEGTRQ